MAGVERTQADEIDPDDCAGPGALRAHGDPGGVPLDAQDLPTLQRDLDRLAGLSRARKPARLLVAAECSIRVHEERSLLGLKRERSLILGWPMLLILDADELGAVVALALAGESIDLDADSVGAHDAVLAAALGPQLLARSLTRVLLASLWWRERWWPQISAAARDREQVPTGRLHALREVIESHGRGGWQARLDRLRAEHPEHPWLARLQGLGGADLSGGSHRNAVQALLWEGIGERITTALDGAFCARLELPWRARHLAFERLRQRVEDLRRTYSEQPDVGIELAGLLEQLDDPRAAFAIYRDCFQRQRLPSAAFHAARTLAQFDPERGRAALQRIATSRHPQAEQASQLLRESSALAPAAQRRTGVGVGVGVGVA